MARPENHQTSLRKLSMVGKKSYSISLPLEAVKQLSWKKGDVLIVRRQGKQFTVQKKED